MNAGKTQLVLLDWPNNTGYTDVKTEGSILEEKSYFKMFGLNFFSKLDWGSYIISVAIRASKKIGTVICSMKFLSPEISLYALFLPGIVRQATKMNSQDCWSCICCFS